MEHSIFGGSESHPLEDDPWKLPSPKLGLLRTIEVDQPWTTHLSDEENNSSNENDNHFDGAVKQDILFGISSELIDDNIMSRSQVIEDAMIADNTLTSNIDTTTTAYDEDAELNNNIWDIELTNSYDPLGFHNSKDKSLIRVKEIPEKEGLVFKHINYMIIHNIKFIGDSTKAQTTDKGDVKIVRRYSDFYWLYEVLLKRYPFRSIPELPPKKFNGNTTSNDSLFLQNRRRGLQRFLNQLIKHPILNKEALVVMFLKVPNDFNNWKKIAKIDLTNEFEGKKFALPSKYKLKYQSIPKEEYEDDEDVNTPVENVISNEQIYKNIEQIWDENDGKQLNFSQNIETLHQNLSKIIDLWNKLTILIERFEKRKAAMSLDELRFQMIMKNFLDNDNKVFQMDKLVDINQQSQLYNFEVEETQNLGIINTLLSKVPNYFENRRIHQRNELSSLNSTHLENFKKFQDYLVAFNDMLDRLILYKASTQRANQVIVGKLVKANEKLTSWLKKPDIKGSDFDKLNNFMNLQIVELNNNIYKIFLVKNCIKFEFKLFNKLKYLLSEIFQDWFADKVKYGEPYGDLLEKCYGQLQELPLR